MSRSLLNFNVHDGCLEAVVRGYQDGLLREDEYNNLCQCENLSDLKSQLQVTDYGNFLQQESELSAQTIVQCAREVLVQQLKEIRCWAEPLLAQFLDFICYEYMISNVLKLIVAKRSGRSNLELLTRCHPLGVFRQLPTMLAASEVKEMFDVVLLDSPVGRFFPVEEGAGGFQRDLDSQSVEYIRAFLLRHYYEEFYDFCDKIGGETRDVMCPVLEAEADRLSLTYTLNTMDLLDVSSADRLRVFPRIGSLVDIHDEIAECESVDMLRERLQRFPTYASMLEEGGGGFDAGDKGAGMGGSSSLERRFVEHAVGMYNDVLTRQFQYGVFYSYVKLKEIEIQNLHWISDCIVQQMRDRLQEYVCIV